MFILQIPPGMVSKGWKSLLCHLQIFWLNTIDEIMVNFSGFLAIFLIVSSLHLSHCFSISAEKFSRKKSC